MSKGLFEETEPIVGAEYNPYASLKAMSSGGLAFVGLLVAMAKVRRDFEKLVGKKINIERAKSEYTFDKD